MTSVTSWVAQENQAAVDYGRAEHQASHKIWGTAIDEKGKYQAIELE